MVRAILLTVIACLGLTVGIHYNGFKVYKVMAQNEVQNTYLCSLELNSDFDFWSKVNKLGAPVSVMVAPEAQIQFESELNRLQMDFSIEIDDVERTIQTEKEYHRAIKPLKAGRITFDQYLRHNEINAYLAQLAEDYPDIVTIETIGQSYQQRDMNAIRISSGVNTKSAVFIDAGIHAREWIAPAVALYLINQLVENANNTDLSANVEWIILPSMNPDGYEYTWDEERFWRKTRSPGIRCDGCDANRNFGYHWMEAGASSDECLEIYAGKSAFSEIEAQNLRNFLANNSNIKGYLSLHSYGQYILYPWSYDDVLPDNADELQALGEEIHAAIRAVNGNTYIVGSTTATLYAAAGASQDWAMGGAGIPIVYSVELPGGGTWGFDLPPSDIERVVVETFEGLKVFGQYIGNNY